jgi:hypothetical protein
MPRQTFAFNEVSGVEILTVVIMKSSVFWDIMLCSLWKINYHFSGTCHLRLQHKSQAKVLFNLLHATFLLGLFFSYEDGGDKFL